jgi:hypothetical protein
MLLHKRKNVRRPSITRVQLLNQDLSLRADQQGAVAREHHRHR